MMHQSKEILEPGTLWERVLAATRRAVAHGALVSIPTVVTTMVDHGIAFQVRVVTNLERKAKEKVRRDVFTAPSPVDPFLPYDPEMYVADLSETHVCLLNKFNVVDHHILMVTRGFEHQLAPLTYQDFLALCFCLAEYPGVAFYNAGETAGASQPHKHLQMVAEADLAMPVEAAGVASTPSPVPLAPLVDTIDTPGVLRTLSQLPFQHRVVRFAASIDGDVSDWAHRLLGLYRAMLTDLALDRFDPSRAGEGSRFLERLPAQATAPYNLVCTRDWMMMVPRRRECFETLSINALGFCGAFLVRNESERARLEQVGPMQVLEVTGVPAAASSLGGGEP